jgi:hypothetical protein
MSPMEALALARVSSARALWAAVAVVVAGCALIAATGAGAEPNAHRAATKSCDIRSVGRKLGTTYVTSLKVEHVSCAKGQRVVKAFNACRRAHGGVKGRCPSHVLGYHCTETRGASITTQYSSKASCKDASRIVRFAYTQYT